MKPGKYYQTVGDEDDTYLLYNWRIERRVINMMHEFQEIEFRAEKTNSFLYFRTNHELTQSLAYPNPNRRKK